MGRSSRPREIQERSRATASSALIGVGGVLVALAAFLPWVRVAGLHDLDLFRLLRTAGEPEPWAWAAVAFGGAIGLVAFSVVSPRPSDLRVLGFVAFAVVGFGGGVGVVWLLGTVSSTHRVQGVGAGTVLAATAELLFVVAVLLSYLSYPARPAMLRRPATARALAETLGPIPGWYDDPDGSLRVRWWDGTRWTQHTDSYDAAWAAAQRTSAAAGSPADEAALPVDDATLPVDDATLPADDAASLTARSRRPRSWRWVTLLVGALLLLSGGGYLGVVTGTFASAGHPKGVPSAGSGRAPANTSPPVPPLGIGYLATGNVFVDFIEWNVHDGSLAGTAQAAATTGAAPGLDLASETLAVAGTLNGSVITLSFDDGPRTSATISGGSFTLDFPQPDAAPAPITFDAATLDQYNSAVAGLRQRIDQANQAAVSAQRDRQVQQKIDADAATVAGDIASLSRAEATLDRDAESVSSSLQLQEDDLLSAHQGELQVGTAVQQPGALAGHLCTEAGAVVVQADRVGRDLDRVRAAVDGVGSDLSQVRSLLWTLVSAAAQLANDEAALPGYRPPQSPGQNDVAQAVAAANADVAATLSKVNGYVDTGNGYAAAATQYAAQAAQVANCGWSPPPAPSVLHLS